VPILFHHFHHFVKNIDGLFIRSTLREFSLKHKDKNLNLSTLFFPDNSILNHIYIKFQGLYIMKIAIAGTGYVGLSNAVLLSQHNIVLALELIADKVGILNNHLSPFTYPLSPIPYSLFPIPYSRY
jgi:hypothetical protein